MKIWLFLILLCAIASAQRPDVIASYFSSEDFDLTADPDSPAWKGIPGVFAERGPRGEPAPGHRTEIRSRWTERHLYFLFICPYEQLYLKPNPTTKEETNKLWEWDVAEVFIGTDFTNIRQYKEFQVSPQGEWVDLDIDRDNPKPEGGWRWNSGFEVKARVDPARKIWYGEMKIPIAAIDRRKPEPGLEMRINFYRIQGPPPQRVFIAWRPTGAPSYHVPEAFGRLRLEKAPR
ncbi:MAG TPA: carbohydrate-binding family 9-like protein [Bryobacteraceae bacterium]|nr:carbohydrate-binding family 9-like protein [Bryobacteraceae bacterium]